MINSIQDLHKYTDIKCENCQRKAEVIIQFDDLTQACLCLKCNQNN